MRIKPIILTIVFSVFLGACCASYPSLTEKDNGSRISLRSGQDLQIELASNPSTGYSWNIVSIDPTLLKQVGEKEYRQESNRKGGGGHTTFRFRGIGKGKLALELAYYRGWEKNPSYEKTITVTILVK